ncbi:MAG: 16S rRNA (cytidine(1402)-2'-O)-methyltransferase [uncultured Thermomicrobiales bacterium]|uniref:Ribosomal RNA small subunit methyltransferase I n=1 Tax=uncultured Thermomicrobiales bacterium TaxID=1645740 RepID=A0A6J4VPZ6_9BACT|nr:MAG: 16S rRNA (cytidine(1402)-2'-O)-methyltransferase [uncultured Thermomicrobiales bacterium]
MGTLFIVATPIGNLGDMTFRAVETLRNVALIAAEDTRHSSILLREFGITTHMISYHQHNMASRESRILRELETGDVALISDAGTPGIADPGVEIVARAFDLGHRVVPIPGASAITAAVSASGLVPGPFLFVGFLPRSGEDRRVAIGKAAAAGVPFVVYEAPTRLVATLDELWGSTGNRRVMVARELTKMHEELRTGTVDELRSHFRTTPPRGEFVIVVGAADAHGTGSGDVEAVVRQLLADGARPSRAAREASAITGLSGSDAYEIVRRIAREAADEPGLTDS